MSILLNSDALLVPAGDGVSDPLVLDMTEIYKADTRLCELASVTQMKAGELASAFITAWGKASSYRVKVSTQFARAKHRVRQVKAIIVLDKSTDILKAKGLLKTGAPAGSADLREAVVDSDPDYSAAVMRLAEIEAINEMMEIKAERFKMAYFTLNKLIGGHDANKETSGGAGSDDVGSYSDQEKATQFAQEHAFKPETYSKGFGTAKY